MRGRERRIKTLWAHSAAAGAWAREIARLRRMNVESAFLIGLMHDIGRPVLLQLVSDLARELQGEGGPTGSSTTCPRSSTSSSAAG